MDLTFQQVIVGLDEMGILISREVSREDEVESQLCDLGILFEDDQARAERVVLPKAA